MTDPSHVTHAICIKLQSAMLRYYLHTFGISESNPAKTIQRMQRKEWAQPPHQERKNHLQHMSVKAEISILSYFSVFKLQYLLLSMQVPHRQVPTAEENNPWWSKDLTGTYLSLSLSLYLIVSPFAFCWA